tara:strand:- start:33 stop:179 length:147 start_codon:yes stop_codon:yes gene_type:complete
LLGVVHLQLVDQLVEWEVEEVKVGLLLEQLILEEVGQVILLVELAVQA